jgi:actin cytoskeleton-regulatory complex protein SLA1
VPANAGGLFSGPGGALRQPASKKTRPTPSNPAPGAVDEKAFGSKPADSKSADRKPPSKSIIDGFEDDAWDIRDSKKPASPTVTSVSPPPAPLQPTPTGAIADLSGLSLSSPPLQPTVVETPPAQPESPPASSPATKQGAAPSLFEQLSKSSVANQANNLRQRPQPPAQTLSQNSLIAPPPARAASAPQSGLFLPPGQQQSPMQQLAPQMTGYGGPMMQSQVAPPGQSLHEMNQQMQMQQQHQRLMQQATGMGYGGFPGSAPYQQPMQTGYNQAMVNGQQTGSPFADPVGQQYQPMMPMHTGMPMGTNMSMYQQPQQTGVNSFLPPALIPQNTGMPPQQTGVNYGMNMPQQQAPPMPPFPSIPIPPIPQHLQTPAPLIPQRTGPAPPVRFGVQNGAAKKLVPQPTGKRANLSAASKWFFFFSLLQNITSTNFAFSCTKSIWILVFLFVLSFCMIKIPFFKVLLGGLEVVVVIY